MDGQRFQSSACTSTECMVEIGQLPCVDQKVGGSVSKFATMFSVAVRLTGKDNIHGGNKIVIGGSINF